MSSTVRDNKAPALHTRVEQCWASVRDFHSFRRLFEEWVLGLSGAFAPGMKPLGKPCGLARDPDMPQSLCSDL